MIVLLFGHKPYLFMELQRFAYSRWILVLPLALCGILYLFHFTGMTQMSSGVLPGNPGAWAVMAGLAMLIAAGAIAAKRFDKFAALGVALLLTFFTAAVYAPCLGQGDGAMQFSSGFNLFKDMVLAAGSLAYAGLASARM